MTSLIMALLSLAVGPGESVQPAGTVVDEKGRALAGVTVMLSAWGKTEPDDSTAVLVRATTDENGQFLMAAPPLSAFKGFPLGTIWAFTPGRGLGAAPYTATGDAAPVQIRLVPPGARHLMLERRDGSPVGGVTVAPESMFVRSGQGGGRSMAIPDELIELLATLSDARGHAVITTFAPNERLIRVRVSSKGTALQAVQTPVPVPAGDKPIEILVEPVGTLAGRVQRTDGRSPEGLIVRIESSQSPNSIADAVRFAGGPIRVAADGRFRAPAAVLAGMRYRAVIDADGLEPAATPWIDPAGEGKTAMLADLELSALHDVKGRVVDRQGRPIAGARVLQSGDGPARTTSHTDAQGAFRLPGYSAEHGLIFAHAPGFRFGGRVIPEGDVTIVLTRVSEAPERPLPTLPPALPAAELRSLARRVLDPYLQAVMKEGDTARGAQRRAVEVLAILDPAAALEALAARKGLMTGRMPVIMAAELSRTDVDRAAAFAETLAPPLDRARALVAIADAQSNKPKVRRLALLDKALVLSRTASKPAETLEIIGDVAERLAEQGEAARAKTLLAEGLAIAKTLPNTTYRGRFGVPLARDDLPAALALIDSLPSPRERSRILANAAIRLAGVRPQDCEQLLGIVTADDRARAMDVVCYRMAPVDPERAQRLVRGTPDSWTRGRLGIMFASGLAKRSKVDVEKAFRQAFEALEESSKDHETAYFSALLSLPLVEEIDPSLVPEALWHALALRTAVRGGDGGTFGTLPREAQIVVAVAHYDRELAAALWGPLATRLETTERDSPFRLSFYPPIVWAYLDPRAAVEWIEAMPKGPTIDPNGQIHPRIVLSRLLAVWSQGGHESLIPYVSGPVEELSRRDLR